MRGEEDALLPFTKEALCAGGLACYSIDTPGRLRPYTARTSTLCTLVIGSRIVPSDSGREQPAKRSIRTQHALCTPPWFAQARSPGRFGTPTNEALSGPPLVSACYPGRLGLYTACYTVHTTVALSGRMLPRACDPPHSQQTGHYPGRFGPLHSLDGALPRAARPATQPTNGALSGRLLPTAVRPATPTQPTDGTLSGRMLPRDRYTANRQTLFGRMLPRAVRASQQTGHSSDATLCSG